MTIRPVAIALLLSTALALGACSDAGEQSAAEEGVPTDENVITGTVPAENVETDADPTAQSGTGGAIPEGPRGAPAE